VVIVNRDQRSFFHRLSTAQKTKAAPEASGAMVSLTLVARRNSDGN